MSVRRPTVKRPGIPKITRPSISKRKRLVSKTPSLSKKRIIAKTTSTKHVTKKSSRKISLGTCYLQTDCSKVLTRKVTRQQCKKQGGKSWKKTGGGACEKL